MVSQGFRHAAILLITGTVRKIAHDAPADVVSASLDRLAHDLAGLAGDMRAAPDSSEWLIDELTRTIARLPHVFDRELASASAAEIIRMGASHPRPFERCDLFLVYVPEDRLPIAAPLAIELTKRRVTVAFAGFEVASADELVRAIDQGMRSHGRGALLRTDEFDRKGWRVDAAPAERLRILRGSEVPLLMADLLAWLRQ